MLFRSIELALNLSLDGNRRIREHLERFKKGYARYERTGVVLHFETKTSRDKQGPRCC